MATNNRTADVLLKFQVDSASVNRVRASFNALDTELDDLRSSLLGVGTSAQTGVNGLRQRFAAGEASVESMQDEVEQLRRELLALDDVKVTPQVEVQGGGIRGSSTLNTVDRFGRFGTQIAGGFGNSGLGNVVGLVGDVADSFGTLGVAGGAAALAVGGLSLAINELKRIADEAKAAEAARLAGEIAGEAQAGSSPQELKARALELIAQIDANDRALAERRQEISDLEVEYRNADITRAQEYYGRVAAINDEITRLQNANTTALGEFIEVSGQYQRAQQLMAAVGPALEYINNEWGGFLTGLGQLATFLITGAGQLQAAAGFTGGIAAGSGFANNSKTQKAAADAAAAQLLSDRTDKYLNAITETVKAQELLTKAQEAYNAEVSASAGRIAEINRKLQDDLAQAETERQSDLEEAARQAGEDRVKATEDAEKERLRIQKRFDRSYAEAVADRDALAAKRAEDQRDDELGQLNDRYKDQLKTIDKALATQQRTIEQRYASQVATINAAAQAAVRTEQAASQARIAVLQQTLQTAQTAMINASNAELMIRANLYNQTISQATVWANTMQFLIGYGLNIPTSGGGSNVGGGGGGSVRVIARASGGPVMPNQPYLVGEKGPELVTFPRSGYVNPNGAGLTINVVGAQQDTIRITSRQQAIAVFNGALDKLGVA